MQQTYRSRHCFKEDVIRAAVPTGEPRYVIELPSIGGWLKVNPDYGYNPAVVGPTHIKTLTGFVGNRYVFLNQDFQIFSDRILVPLVDAAPHFPKESLLKALIYRVIGNRRNC